MPILEIDIKTIRSGNGLKFSIQITEQRLRGVAAKLTTSNGFTFKSISAPAIGVGFNDGYHTINMNGLLYLRGSARSADRKILRTSSVGYINKLKAAIEEYNAVKEVIL